MNPNIHYTIAMPQPHSHLYEVTLTVDGMTTAETDLALPVWTPGSYMVREYARHLQDVAATDAAGAPLPWRKIDKSTWRVNTSGVQHMHVRYRVYANELTVRTSHLDGSHGYFNPATLCLYLPGRQNEPHGISIQAPAGWRVSTGLTPQADTRDETQDQASGRARDQETSGQRQGEPAPNASLSTLHSQRFTHTFIAADYDELVDCPFECGTHRLLTFQVDGIPHEVAIWGHGNEDEAQFLADIQKIVETERDMFGGLPYQRYLFIFHLADGYGGLEHRNSVTNLVDRWSFQPRRKYERVLGLTSHEFFHVWNVKRIRPAPLGPFDYSRENYTRQLWTMEGVTSYYDDLLLLRAGLISRERYLEIVADEIVFNQSQPGRLVQSLEQSSFDAWIKFYRPDEHSSNSAISYYRKGMLVSLLLDLEIRQRTGGARALDDVLRALFATSAGPGFAEAGGYQEVVEEIAASPFDTFFARYIAGTDELDYATPLSYAGLRLEWGYTNTPNGQPPAWAGFSSKTEHGTLKVASVRADGPALAAGVYAGDELLALDGFRIDEEQLNARLAERRPGDTISLSLFRRNELLHLRLTLAAAPPDRLVLLVNEAASAAQRALLAAWLG